MPQSLDKNITYPYPVTYTTGLAVDWIVSISSIYSDRGEAILLTALTQSGAIWTRRLDLQRSCGWEYICSPSDIIYPLPTTTHR